MMSLSSLSAKQQPIYIKIWSILKTYRPFGFASYVYKLNVGHQRENLNKIALQIWIQDNIYFSYQCGHPSSEFPTLAEVPSSLEKLSHCSSLANKNSTHNQCQLAKGQVVLTASMVK